jgi:prepilin peptidase CpaA
MFDSVLLLAFPLLLSLAAGWDIASYTIPNWLTAALALLFLPVAFTVGLSPAVMGAHLAVGFVLLVLGIGLFAAGVAGGGDAKLLAAAGLWLGPQAVLTFLFYTAMAGGVLVVFLIFFRRLPLPAGLARIAPVMRLHEPGGGVPYGAALAIAGLLAYPASPLFHALA